MKLDIAGSAFQYTPTETKAWHHYEQNRVNRLLHPERSRAYTKKHRAKPESKEKRRTYAFKFKQSQPEKVLWFSAASRAKKANLDFNLEISDITVPSVCPILGIPLVTHMNDGHHAADRDSPSLDRIDPRKGYVKGNVRVISYRANAMKQDASPSELRVFAAGVLKYVEGLE